MSLKTNSISITFMKKILLSLCCISLLVIGCKQKNTSTISMLKESDTVFYNCRVELPAGIDTFSVAKCFNIEWPSGMDTLLLQRLTLLAFGDSSGNIYNATEQYLKDLMLSADEKLVQAIEEETPPDIWENEGLNYNQVDIVCHRDKNLYRFEVSSEKYYRHSAHGMSELWYVTYDNNEKQLVALNDLVDTNLLRPIIAKAVQELEVNAELKSYFEGASAKQLPVSWNFFIDDERDALVLVYNELVGSDGVDVTLPVAWLSKQLKLTPYGKRLLEK